MLTETCSRVFYDIKVWFWMVIFFCHTEKHNGIHQNKKGSNIFFENNFLFVVIMYEDN